MLRPFFALVSIALIASCSPRPVPPPAKPLPLKMTISPPYQDAALETWSIPISVTNGAPVAVSAVFVTCRLRSAQGRQDELDVGVISNLPAGGSGSTDIVHVGSDMPPATCRITSVLR